MQRVLLAIVRLRRTKKGQAQCLEMNNRCSYRVENSLLRPWTLEWNYIGLDPSYSHL